jgi:hypothetical protein
MHALRDRNQGIDRAIEPLPGAAGGAEGRRTSRKIGLLQTFAATLGRL